MLAANALAGTGPTAGLFRGERLPEGLNADELLAAGVEIDRRARRTPGRHRRSAERQLPADDGADGSDAAAARGGCRSSTRA